MRRTGLILLAVAVSSACAEESRLYLPDGDAVAGRVAFQDMRCYVCHEVLGEDFPPSRATPPVAVTLGPEVAIKSKGALAESVIAPSHRITREYTDLVPGELSRMGDYGEAMTVRQLIDIVAYLRTLDAVAGTERPR